MAFSIHRGTAIKQLPYTSSYAHGSQGRGRLMVIFKCIHDGCTNSVEIKSRWDSIKACSGERGWYQSKDKTITYCPEHLPDWVIPWRKNRAIQRT